MSWRPKEGLDNPWKFFQSCNVEKTAEGYEVAKLAGVFEAGADAYEAALFKYFYDNGIELWESGYMKGSDELKALEHVPMSRFVSEEDRETTDG